MPRTAPLLAALCALALAFAAPPVASAQQPPDSVQAQVDSAEADVRAAAAERQSAEADLQRFEALLVANAGSRKQRDDALTRRDVATARVAAARDRARAAAEALEGRPLLVRTLDAGADKPIAGLEREPEANPFLGMRGIRLGLERPELLGAQLRALCRVAADHRLRIMFPMVATTDELAAARVALEEARDQVGDERAPGGGGAEPVIEVGIMVEVPSAALMASSLAGDCDFFSIGTNDLTQYAMAADRGNEHVADLNDPLHPAVLRLIATTVEGAATRDRWVGICGELAGDELAAPLLLGLGVRELSMAAPAIAAVKHAVRSTSLDDARTLASSALACATAAEVRAMLASP